MAKKTKKNPNAYEGDLDLLLQMWDQKGFVTVVSQENRAVAQVAEVYWNALEQRHGEGEVLSKRDFLIQLVRMPPIKAEDRCRVALNTAVRFRDKPRRLIGTVKDMLALADQLYKEDDATLKQAALYGATLDVFNCACLAAQYGKDHVASLRMILSAWMVQK